MSGLRLPHPQHGLRISRRSGTSITPAAARHLRWRPTRITPGCVASAEAGRLLTEGKAKYEGGDRMGALRLWERALAAEPTPEQRRAALFNSTAVHAAFGDVELAQITLREAVQGGLNFSAAALDPGAVDPQLVKLIASQQVLIRLRKFSEATQRKMGAAAAPLPFPSGGSSSGGGGKGGGRSALLERDLSKMLETDMQGIDTSIVGVVRRVLLLLLALSGLGAGLFYFGLKYLMVDPTQLSP